MDSSTAGLSSDGLLVGLGVVLTLVGWFFAFRDLLRRDDAGTGTKVVWGVVVVVLGIVGVVLYFLFRPRGATQAERDARQQASDDFVRRHTAPPAQDRPATDPPAGPSSADPPSDGQSA